MEIISHRGYWNKSEEKNKSEAFIRSFDLGFGTETDLRDLNRNIVISHDPADNGSMLVDDFFDLYNRYNQLSTLALNIKADGLQAGIQNLVKTHKIHSYFVFDMSIPDTLGYIKHKIPFFSRQSEHELLPAFYEQCEGIWLDCFIKDWYDDKLILKHIQNNKRVAIVSPELHGRNHLALWEMLKSTAICTNKKVILCTDFPMEARNFFQN
ncbi:hypothetical protein [Pedobacter aquatilis]|uniref:hypothetical protein n=1 Tax=Pedobacter aquatilis TaxID=351343 RepID=UPI00292EE1CB|nr:hypothetical protein [Pedobacter aquatilis]